VEFLRPVPAVAVIPLFVLITGSGSPTKIALAGLSAFFPILLQTILGVRDVDPTAVQTAKAFQLSWARQFFQIILPWSAPFIVTGLRIASTLALLVTVSTEIIVGAPGLGRAIMLSQNAGLENVMYVYIIVAGLIGVIINMLLSALEAKLLAWTPAQREDSK
jgi:ABC-type nitrate/sulfonate/bicarbonate transport system permease component